LVGKKPATDKEAPPKDCLHATEPGAVTPQLLWSYPRREPGELAGEVLPFCFPNGVRVERSKPDGDDDAFVFQLSLPDDGPAAAAAAGQSQSLVYGVCVVEWASRATASGSFAVPRATCLLTRLPLLDLHAAVLRDALAVARRSRDRHLALRRVFGRYAAVEAPKPGMPAAFAADPAAEPRRGVRPAATTGLDFLRGARPVDLPDAVAPHMAWTAAEYAAVDATAHWAVPRLLRLLPLHTLLRALAGALCEMQVVVISRDPARGAAAVLGLAALARPLLWVGPLVPVLPAQLHALLEAPVPFLVGAPRTETWARCIAERLPKPGFFVLDADDGGLCFHPHDADLLELPHADALADALAPLVEAARGADAPDAPRARDAAGHAARVVCRHVAKLATVALKFESTQAANPARRSRLAESVRGRESVEFANLMREEFDDGDDDDAAEAPPAGRRGGSVECSRSLVRGGFLAAGDPRASALWAQRSTNLRLDESIARDPMRRVFFERVAESQAYAVYRESFPTFAGFGVGADRPAPAPKRDAGESPTSVDDDPLLATVSWRPPSPTDLPDAIDATPLHRPRASISPQRSKSPHTFAAPAADDDASAFQLDDPSVITELGFEDTV